MAEPPALPGSPIADPECLNTLQTGATSSPSRADDARVALSFASSGPASLHRSQRDNAVEGCPSPHKKKQCSIPSPRRRVVLTESPDDEIPLERRSVLSFFDVPGSSPESADDNTNNPPAITPSPPAATVDAPSTDPPADPPLSEKAAARAAKKEQQCANARAAEIKRSKQKVQLDASFLNYIRPKTFDADRFKKGHSRIYTENEMQTFDDNFQKQLLFNFSQKRATKKQLVTTQRASRRTEEDIDRHTSAYRVVSNDFRDLSRYILEDIIRVAVGGRFLLCIAKDAVFEKRKDHVQIAAKQKANGTAGDTVRISGRIFLCMTGEIVRCTQNEALRLGMSRGSFLKEYDNEGGYVAVEFEGTNDKMTFSWQEVVTRAKDLMFFGRRFEGFRRFDDLFRKKSDMEYAHHVFRQLAVEYWGDSRSSSLLYAAYQKRQDKCYEARAEAAGVYDVQSFNTDEQVVFRKRFNNLCKWSFIWCLTTHQDYSQPIVAPVDFDNYLNLAKHVYSTKWRFLASLRNVDPKNDPPSLLAYKERQVFCELLALQRVSNYRELSYWALIQTTAYYGWGVRNTVVNASNFWGISVSKSYRDREYSTLLENIAVVQKRLLAKQRKANFTFDNVTQGTKLMDQRGQGNRFLNGTNFVSHKIFPYDDKSYDDVRSTLVYGKDQPIVSPAGMRAYELIDVKSPTLGTTVFLQHEQIPKRDEPDATGNRVDKYLKLTSIARTLRNVQNIFAVSDDDTYYEQCPDYLKVPRLRKVGEYCASREAKKVFDRAWSFQRDVVRDWNPDADSVTQSMILGVTGIDEKDAAGATACFLDLALKFGLITEEENLTWRTGPLAELKTMYVTGDRKTGENIECFQSAAEDRALSIEEKSIQTDTFLDAFECAVFVPGDWHTGMNILQSINKVYWDVLIWPMRDYLKWTRWTKDVRKCYYTASKGVLFMNAEGTRCLMQKFMSDNYDKYDQMFSDRNPANALAQFAIDFDEYLVWCHEVQTDDDHLRLIAGFIRMSNVFKDFVFSYRNQDSVGVEFGYHCMAPIWKILLQNKYLQCWIEQLWMLYGKHPFSILQEFRCNRGVRSYPGKTGKHAMPHDEYIEICNRDLSLMPQMRTIVGMIRNGRICGLAKRCKRAVELFYGPGLVGVREIYRRSTGSKGNQTPEKKVIYEVFSIMLEPKSDKHNRRLINRDTVCNLKPRLKMLEGLKRDKIASETKGIPDDEASRLLNGVRNVYTSFATSRDVDKEASEEADDTLALDRVLEETAAQKDSDAEAAMEAMEFTEEADEESEENEQALVVGKTKIHKYIIENIWADGWEAISEMNIAELRKNQRERRERKKILSRYVLKKVTNMREQSHDFDVSDLVYDLFEEYDEAPWADYVEELRG